MRKHKSSKITILAFAFLAVVAFTLSSFQQSALAGFKKLQHFNALKSEDVILAKHSEARGYDATTQIGRYQNIVTVVANSTSVDGCPLIIDTDPELSTKHIYDFADLNGSDNSYAGLRLYEAAHVDASEILAVGELEGRAVALRIRPSGAKLSKESVQEILLPENAQVIYDFDFAEDGSVYFSGMNIEHNLEIWQQRQGNPRTQSLLVKTAVLPSGQPRIFVFKGNLVLIYTDASGHSLWRYFNLETGQGSEDAPLYEEVSSAEIVGIDQRPDEVELYLANASFEKDSSGKVDSAVQSYLFNVQDGVLQAKRGFHLDASATGSDTLTRVVHTHNIARVAAGRYVILNTLSEHGDTSMHSYSYMSYLDPLDPQTAQTDKISEAHLDFLPNQEVLNGGNIRTPTALLALSEDSFLSLGAITNILDTLVEGDQLSDVIINRFSIKRPIPVDPAEKPEERPDGDSDLKPSPDPEVKPDTKPDTKPETKPEEKPEAKPETKPGVLPSEPGEQEQQPVQPKPSPEVANPETADDIPMNLVAATSFIVGVASLAVIIAKRR